MGRIWSRETKRVLELEPVFLREGFQKKNPEKLCPFDKPGEGGGKKKKKRPACAVIRIVQNKLPSASSELLFLFLFIFYYFFRCASIS